MCGRPGGKGGKGGGRGGGGFRDRDGGGGRGGGDRYGDRPSSGFDDDASWSRKKFGGDRGDRGGFGGDRGGFGGDRGGFGGDRGGFGGDRGDRGGFGGDRGGFGGDRGDRGGFGGDRGGFGGDRGGFGGDRGGFGGDRGGGERPRMNLAPRTLPVGDKPVSDVTAKVESMSTNDEGGGDKWESVFRKPGRASNDARSQRFEDSGDRFGGGGYRDRQDNFRGGGGYGNDSRGGYQSNRYDDSGTDDPRFAGKFGGSGSGPNVSSNRRAESIAAIPTLGLSEADKRKAAKLEEEKKLKEEKAAKAQAKAEAEAKAKAEKEAEKEAEKAKDEAARAHAVTALASGKKGEELKTEIAAMAEKPTGAALLANILSGLEDKQSYGWCTMDQYGAALAYLVSDSDKEQFKLINEIVKFCNTIGFPKIEVKSGTRALIEVVFQLLYSLDIVDATGFNLWWDDEDEEEIPGRGKSILQTTTFMTWLNEEDEDEDEDDVDDDGSLEPPPNNNNIN